MSRYKPSKIGWVSSFFLYFFSCRQGVTAVIKHKSIIQLPLNLVHKKGRIRAHIDTKFWLQYHKWTQCYKWLFTKNNTNVFSCIQAKPLMGRSWKSPRRQSNYWTSNLLLFERNWAIDHEDAAKNWTVGNNHTIEIY